MQNPTQPSPMPRTVVTMMAVMFVGKAMGIYRDRLQAIYFGADTIEANAFMQASILPRHFFDILFASVFSASFIPIFNQYLENKSKKAAFDLAALFITVVLAITAAITLLCIAFTPQLYGLVIDGDALAPETRALGIQLIRIMFPLMVLSGLAFSLTGILQSLGEFRIPAAMSVVSNGIILLYFFFFFERFGVYGLCIAFLIGWGSQTVIQIPFLIKNEFKFHFRFNMKHPALRQIGKLTLPVMAASWIGPVNILVNGKALNTYGGTSDFVSVNFAYALFTVVSGVFVLSVANVVFPALSKQTATGDSGGFQATLRHTLRSLFFFLLPMTFGLMAVSTPLVRLVYLGREFTEAAVQVTGGALFYFSLGILGYGLQIVLSRACYARQDGRTPMVATVVAIGLNLVLSFQLAPSMQANGVALASSISISASAVIMLAVLIKAGHIRLPKPWMLDIGKMLLLSLIMFAVVLWIQTSLHVVLVAAIGAGLYLGGGWLLGLEELANVKRFWKKP